MKGSKFRESDTSHYGENDTTYKKKKPSNTSKSRTKSNHKHQYEECLFVTPGYLDKTKHNLSKGRYCVICGKAEGAVNITTEKLPSGLHRMLTSSEILERYGDLPIFRAKDFWIKAVDIVNDKIGPDEDIRGTLEK